MQVTDEALRLLVETMRQAPPDLQRSCALAVLEAAGLPRRRDHATAGAAGSTPHDRAPVDTSGTTGG